MTLKEKLYDEYIWTTEPIVEAEEVSESVDKMVEIADEFAIGFAEWCIESEGKEYNKYKYRNRKELLEIYKQTL